MFQTSKMTLSKVVKGRTYNDQFMASSTTVSDAGNALGDVSDLQITRQFMNDAYRTCDWIRAITDRGSERAAQVELFPIPLGAKVGVKEGELSTGVRKRMENVLKLFMKPNSDKESFQDLKTKIFRDVFIYDEAGMQIVSATNGLGEKIPYELYCNVSGEELFVNPKKNGTLPDNRAYLQLKNGTSEVASWNKNEMINFIRNKRAGFSNGFSPIETVATSILGDLEGMNFNMKFFENNARPDIAFLFENLGFGKGEGALKRAKTWYLNNHQGKPHLPLFMGSEKGQVKLHELKYSHKDMQFLDWQAYLLSRIMAVYGMQPLVLGLASSGEAMVKLDAAMQSDEFKKNTIIPCVTLMSANLNSGLIWNDDNLNYDDIYVTSANLDIDDEAKQAEIDDKYLDRGVITINQVRNRLQMPPVPWGNLPFVPLNYAPYDTLVEYQKSKIQSNLDRAMGDNIDNNNVVPKDPPKDKVKKVMGMSEYNDLVSGLYGKYSALYSDEFDGNMARYMPDMMKNSKILNGTEKIEPSIVKEIINKLIVDRESKLSQVYSYSSNTSNLHKVTNMMGLSWKRILKKV